MLRQEWRKLFKNKILLIVTVAVIAIPTIYTTLFLGSMWDPYGNIDKLPVAVINHDVPVTYADKELDIGKNLMDELKDNDALDFRFPSETEAQQGLKDGTYYMVITIPEDFSAHAASLTDANPEKMTLAYETNPGTNYIASKMSETAMKELESSVREEVTKTYTEVLFDKLAEVGDGMQEAADGSGELKDGADQLADGSQTITDNLQVLADSALVFADGSRELEVGLDQYTDGVSAAAAGAEELQSGVNALDSGVNDAQKGGADLASGAADVDDNMTALNAGLSELNAAASALPDAADALNDGAASLSDGAAQLSGGIASLSDGAAGLKDGADALSSGLQSAASRSQSLRDGAAGVSQALSALAEAEGVPGKAAYTFFGVDTGTACFADEAASEEFCRFLEKWRGENPGKNLYADYFEERFRERREDKPGDALRRWDLLCWAIPESGRRLVMFSSGVGDGIYSGYWGLDADGEPAELIVPFLNPEYF